jgi:AcrR family transcriptional regulator
MAQHDARTQLLDAAEQVLLARGIDGVSVRSVTAAAGMNVAAVNYTFGGKDALLYALAERLLTPLTAERIRRIDAVTKRADYCVEDLMRAYAVPLLGMDPRIAPLFVELLIRPVPNGNSRLGEVGKDAIRPGLERLIDALAAILPDHPRQTLQFRVRLLFEAAALYLRDEIVSEPDRQLLIDELVALSTAALSVPARPVDSGQPRKKTATTKSSRV